MNVRELIGLLSKEDPEAKALFVFSFTDLEQMAEDQCAEINNVETGDGHEGNEVWMGS